MLEYNRIVSQEDLKAATIKPRILLELPECDPTSGRSDRNQLYHASGRWPRVELDIRTGIYIEVPISQSSSTEGSSVSGKHRYFRYCTLDLVYSAAAPFGSQR